MALAIAFVLVLVYICGMAFGVGFFHNQPVNRQFIMAGLWFVTIPGSIIGSVVEILLNWFEARGKYFS